MMQNARSNSCNYLRHDSTANMYIDISSNINLFLWIICVVMASDQLKTRGNKCTAVIKSSFHFKDFRTFNVAFVRFQSIDQLMVIYEKQYTKATK